MTTEQNPPSPLSDATLQEIRDRIHEARDMPGGFDVLYGDAETVVTSDIYDLLDEVERLQKQVIAMREIVQAVAKDWRWQVITADDDKRYCMWCGGSLLTHQESCPVTKARALLANNE